MASNHRDITPRDRARSLAAAAVFFTTLALVSPFLLVLLVVIFGKGTNLIVERVAPAIAALVFRVGGIRFEIREHADSVPTPAVFIFNHGSVVDTLSVLALGLPRVRFVVKWELQYNPLFFILGRLTGQIFLRRGDSERAVATLHRAYDRLKENHLSLLMAPEGTRAHREVIGPFKKGPFRTAMDLGYPIVPIYFEGNRELGRGRSLWTKPGRSIAHIHPPIDTSGWALEDIDRRIESVREKYLEWAGVREEARRDGS